MQPFAYCTVLCLLLMCIDYGRFVDRLFYADGDIVNVLCAFVFCTVRPFRLCFIAAAVNMFLF